MATPGASGYTLDMTLGREPLRTGPAGRAPGRRPAGGVHPQTGGRSLVGAHRHRWSGPISERLLSPGGDQGHDSGTGQSLVHLHHCGWPAIDSAGSHGGGPGAPGVELLEWAAKRAFPSGTMAEQLHPYTGEPSRSHRSPGVTPSTCERCGSTSTVTRTRTSARRAARPAAPGAGDPTSVAVVSGT